VSKSIKTLFSHWQWNKTLASLLYLTFFPSFRYDSVKHEIDHGPTNPRVGTIRYMAPENLHLNSEEVQDVIESVDFSNFILADIYSSGLVLWEILRRTAYYLEEEEEEEEEEKKNPPTSSKVLCGRCQRKPKRTSVSVQVGVSGGQRKKNLDWNCFTDFKRRKKRTLVLGELCFREGWKRLLWSSNFIAFQNKAFKREISILLDILD